MSYLFESLFLLFHFNRQCQILYEIKSYLINLIGLLCLIPENVWPYWLSLVVFFFLMLSLFYNHKRTFFVFIIYIYLYTYVCKILRIFLCLVFGKENSLFGSNSNKKKLEKPAVFAGILSKILEINLGFSIKIYRTNKR